MIKKLVGFSLLTTIIVTGGITISPANAVPAADPTNSPNSVRTTTVGGINLVPTPNGFKLGHLTEQLMSECTIGAGCAARTWQRLIGADANDPGSVLVMISNVGILPTVRLAQRDQAAVAQRFNTFKANAAFVGNIKQRQNNGLHILSVSGYFDQTLDDYVRLVQVRKGVRTVYIAVNLDNRNSTAMLPKQASISNLVKKAKAVFQNSWAQVPNTVMP